MALLHTCQESINENRLCLINSLVKVKIGVEFGLRIHYCVVYALAATVIIILFFLIIPFLFFSSFLARNISKVVRSLISLNFYSKLVY